MNYRRRSFIFLKLSILLLCPFSRLAGERVLPVFLEEWYSTPPTHALPPTKIDSCHTEHYEFKYKAKDKNDLVTQLFNELPPGQNCQWEKPVFNGYGGMPPVGFFNPFDYADVMKQPGAVKAETWASWCKRGTYGVELVSHGIFPLYGCPAGTRVGHCEQGSSRRCCTNEPPVCLADVVGRDLNEGAATGWLGHVGLALDFDLNTYQYGNFVLEALNNSKVINVNTMRSFEFESPYWGERYGLRALTNL